MGEACNRAGFVSRKRERDAELGTPRKANERRKADNKWRARRTMALDGGRHGKRCNCKKGSQKSGNMHKNMVSTEPLNARLRGASSPCRFQNCRTLAEKWPHPGRGVVTRSVTRLRKKSGQKEKEFGLAVDPAVSFWHDVRRNASGHVPVWNLSTRCLTQPLDCDEASVAGGSSPCGTSRSSASSPR